MEMNGTTLSLMNVSNGRVGGLDEWGSLQMFAAPLLSTIGWATIQWCASAVQKWMSPEHHCVLGLTLGGAGSVLTQNPIPFTVASTACFSQAEAADFRPFLDVVSDATSALDILEEAGLLKGVQSVSNILGASLVLKDMVQFQRDCVAHGMPPVACSVGNVATHSGLVLGDRLAVGITALGIAEVVGGIATLPGGMPAIIDGSGKIIMGFSGIGAMHALSQQAEGFLETTVFAVDKAINAIPAYTQFAIVKPTELLVKALSQGKLTLNAEIGKSTREFLKKIKDSSGKLKNLSKKKAKAAQEEQAMQKQREKEQAMQKQREEDAAYSKWIDAKKTRLQEAKASYESANAFALQKYQQALDSANRVQNAYAAYNSARETYSSMLGQYQTMVQGCEHGALPDWSLGGALVYLCGMWPNTRKVFKSAVDKQRNAVDLQRNYANALIATYQNLVNAHNVIQQELTGAVQKEKSTIEKYNEVVKDYNSNSREIFLKERRYLDTLLKALHSVLDKK